MDSTENQRSINAFIEPVIISIKSKIRKNSKATYTKEREMHLGNYVTEQICY